MNEFPVMVNDVIFVQSLNALVEMILTVFGTSYDVFSFSFG